MSRHHLVGLSNELRVATKLIDLGYIVLQDLNHFSRTDLYVRCAGNCYAKLQVKTAMVKKKNHRYGLSIRLGTSHRSQARVAYTRAEVDFFVGVDFPNFYIVSYDEAYGLNPGKNSCYLRRDMLERWDLLPPPMGAEVHKKPSLRMVPPRPMPDIPADFGPQLPFMAALALNALS